MTITTRSVINLTVHGIGPHPRPLDPGEDLTWVTIDQFERVLDAVVGRREVRITFDDGNASDLEIALPRLLERGLTAEFFVLAGLLGHPGRLDADGVRELVRNGMRIGSHGWAHRDWRRIGPREADEEIHEANALLSELAGHPVSRVAIPFGSYDRRVLRRLRQAGITRAFTSDRGPANPRAWLQPRNSLSHNLDEAWIRDVLDGTASPAMRARRLAARTVKRLRSSRRPIPYSRNTDLGTLTVGDHDPLRSPELKIAVVIVTYNSADYLKGCLDALREGAQGVELTSVVVADNASKDEWAAIVSGTVHLPVVPLPLGTNMGYAGAINAALKVLDLDRLDAVLVLNPDCRVRPGALAVLAQALGARPRRGIVAPRLLNTDGTLQPSLRRTPTLVRAAAEAVMGGGRAGRIGALGELITDERRYEHAGSVAWATGAALLISTTALREIGPWDESYLLYSEETDFQLRAADLGWQVWYEPAAVIEHDGGESATNPMLASLIAVNRVRLFQRRRGLAAGMAYYAVVVAGEAVRALTGRRTSRAALTALLRPSKRLRTLPN